MKKRILAVCLLLLFGCKNNHNESSSDSTNQVGNTSQENELNLSDSNDLNIEKNETKIKEEQMTQNEITTASGLKYVDIVIGDGELPSVGDKVKVHYTGTLLDGTKFDSSRDRNKPFEFPLGAGRVIKGWDEGLATMKVGGQRKLIIPPDLGYGSRAAGKIPPNSTLVFDVELLEVIKQFKDTDFDLPGKEIVLESGLRIIEHIKGKGENPTSGKKVKVHYSGFLQTGMKFDSSHDRGKPFEFVLGQGQVIKGWDEGIAQLKKGGKSTLIIPPELGYGERGAGGVIPPNSTLLFEVELIDF